MSPTRAQPVSVEATVSMPKGGSHPRVSEKKMTASSASQNCGVA